MNKKIKILSYINHDDDLDVDIAHDHAEEARKPNARVIWLKGDAYDQIFIKLRVDPKFYIKHRGRGDISLVYTYPRPGRRPTQRALAKALIRHIEEASAYRL